MYHPTAPPLLHEYDLPPTYLEATSGQTKSENCDDFKKNDIYSPNNLIENVRCDVEVKYGKGKLILTPVSPFNPQIDAQLIHDAIVSGPNKMQIIKIVCNRSVTQRLEIARQYLNSYGRYLITDLRNFIGDNLIVVFNALFKTYMEYFIYELNYAIKNDIAYCQEMLISLSFDEMELVKKIYLEECHNTLINDCDKYSMYEPYKNAIKSILLQKRESDDIEHPSSILQTDVAEFINRQGKTYPDDSKNFQVRDILCIRSFRHIKKIAIEYERITRNSLEKMIESDFATEIKHLYLSIVRYAMNKQAFFAKGLEHSMKGLGTSDRELIRIIVLRSEIDLFDIKREFKNLTNASLKDWIKDDTNGFYKYALYELIGEPKEFK